MIRKLRFYGQRQVTNVRIRGAFASLARYIYSKKKSYDLLLSNEPELLSLSSALELNGIAHVGWRIDDAKVKAIRAKLDPLQTFDPFHKGLGSFNPKNPPSDVHVAMYNRTELSMIPEIMEVALDERILSVVQDFLGCRPTISNVNAWWSYPGHSKAEDAQLFHRDADNFRFCKLMIYLTDVDELCGPHIYIKGTANINRLNKIRRYSDKEIEQEFGIDSQVSFTGDSGSMALVNTYGFHKGLLPKSKERLILQIQYSQYAIGVEDYSPVKSSGQLSHETRLLFR